MRLGRTILWKCHPHESESFHPDSKVLHSEFLIERVAWGAFIALGVTLALAITYNLWSVFLNRAVNVNYTKYKQINAVAMPTITV